MNTIWWQTVVNAPVTGPVLAFVTTLHCALVVLLRHKSRRLPGSLTMIVPAIGFVASAWLLSGAGWVVTVLVAHVAWLRACEKLVRAEEDRSRTAAPANPPAARRVVEPARRAPARTQATRGFVAMPVLAVLAETPEIRTFRIARPEGFVFTPGQFAIVRVDVDGQTLVRCYSISSSPSASGYFEISVRRQGQVSGFLHATVRPGASLEICGPQGSFVHPEGSRPILLLAAGIGITPLISMLRHALESEPQRPVTLILSAKTEQHVPFLRELRLLSERHPMFRLAIALSQGAPVGDAYYPGRIDGSLIETVGGEVRESVCLLCGPLPMIDGAVQMLTALGVPRERIRYEKFEAATASAKTAVSSHASDEAAEPLCVRMQKRGRVVAVTGGQSILDAVETAGEELPSSCRAGVCGTCRTRVLDGDVEGEFDAIGDEDRAQGFVLACVARPVTNCVIDA